MRRIKRSPRPVAVCNHDLHWDDVGRYRGGGVGGGRRAHHVVGVIRPTVGERTVPARQRRRGRRDVRVQMRRQGDKHRPRRWRDLGVVLGMCGSGKTCQHHEGSEQIGGNFIPSNHRTTLLILGFERRDAGKICCLVLPLGPSPRWRRLMTFMFLNTLPDPKSMRRRSKPWSCPDFVNVAANSGFRKLFSGGERRLFLRMLLAFPLLSHTKKGPLNREGLGLTKRERLQKVTPL